MDIKNIIEQLKKEMFNEELLVFPCRDNIEIPKYTHEGDACLDIRAGESITILPNETKVIPTGLKVIIPKGYELQIKARSGISLNTPLRLSNSVGIVDSLYKDEVGVIITNTSIENSGTYLINEKGNKQGIYEIKKGDRIAQISLHKIITTNIKVIDENTFNRYNDKNRGGGLGHSGTN